MRPATLDTSCDGAVRGLVSSLAHVRILDLSRQLPGPFCSSLLADLGADVLAIAAPDDPFGVGMSLLARNKRSMRLNLKHAAGRDILHRLAAEADVLLEGFRPGVTARLGIDYPTLAAVNPRLVYEDRAFKRGSRPDRGLSTRRPSVTTQRTTGGPGCPGSFPGQQGAGPGAPGRSGRAPDPSPRVHPGVGDGEHRRRGGVSSSRRGRGAADGPLGPRSAARGG